MRWSALREPKTSPASTSAPSSVTTRNLPRAGPSSGIHSWSMLWLDSLSSWRMNSRAWRLRTEFPFLNWSSSSSTVMGIATSCSWKFCRALKSYSTTEVSRTKILRSGSGISAVGSFPWSNGQASSGVWEGQGGPPCVPQGGIRSPVTMPPPSSPTPLSARLRVLAAAALFSSGGAAIKAVHLAGWQVACFRSAIAALALFVLGRDPVSATAPRPLLGNLLSLISGITWALTIMGLRDLGRRAGAEGGSWAPAAAFWGNVFAALGCLPLALPVVASRPLDWAILGYLGVFQIAIAYLFLLRGLEKVRAFEASLLLLLEPVLNPIWAWLVHGERPGSGSLAGGGVILLATLVKSWVDSRSPEGVGRPEPVPD